jgi:hypothetical protein
MYLLLPAKSAPPSRHTLTYHALIIRPETVRERVQASVSTLPKNRYLIKPCSGLYFTHDHPVGISWKKREKLRAVSKISFTYLFIYLFIHSFLKRYFTCIKWVSK